LILEIRVMGIAFDTEKVEFLSKVFLIDHSDREVYEGNGVHLDRHESMNLAIRDGISVYQQKSSKVN